MGGFGDALTATAGSYSGDKAGVRECWGGYHVNFPVLIAVIAADQDGTLS